VLSEVVSGSALDFVSVWRLGFPRGKANTDVKKCFQARQIDFFGGHLLSSETTFWGEEIS
jgi:hypothetical protein